jgi:CRISPR/Cas system CSM-associated protein Csm2 small subunit
MNLSVEKIEQLKLELSLVRLKKLLNTQQRAINVIEDLMETMYSTVDEIEDRLADLSSNK